MSIQYAGGTNVSSTFVCTTGTRREIVDGLTARLVTAGWTHISGQGTGDVLMESATTPTNNKIRVRIWDPAAGNCARLQMKSSNGLQTSRDFFLLPGVGKAYRVIASRYQFFCFTAGSTAPREFVMCSCPYIPSFLNGIVTGDLGIMQGNGDTDTDSTARVSFRTDSVTGDSGGYNEIWAGMANGFLNNRAATMQGTACRLRLVIAYNTSVQDPNNGYRWHDDSLLLSEPLLAWGIQDPTDEAKLRGQLWDSVWASDAFTGDTANFNFDGHNWYAITSNNLGTAYRARGTLLHVIP